MTEPIQPIVPEGTPLPPAPVGVPPFPITPFAVWTWSSPVIPEFYWNVYSAEQRIKQICKEIGKIEAYLQYLVNATNSNIIELHKRIDVLTERVAALEKKVEEEVARLDALIAQLRDDLEQEIADREAADDALDDRIDQEINDRQAADGVLHEEIAKEVEDRIHADDNLHGEISTETQNRIHADDQLHEEISKRLLPTEVLAGNEIEITKDPNSNAITISSTVAHSISELETLISGLQAALTAETAERRADDASLWTAVNERIERGKILAGPGIKVVNDPDSSTVTISATGGGTGGTTIEAGTGIKVESEGDTATVSLAAPYPTVEGTAPVKVEARSSTTPGAGSTGTTYSVGVSPATEEEAGIISEARVKELASGPSLSAEAPLKLEDGQISLTKDPAGPVTSSEAGLSVREITPETESETEAGVVSKETIKSLVKPFDGGVDPNGGLKTTIAGLLAVNFGYNKGYNNLGVGSNGGLTLVGRNSNTLDAATDTIAEPIGEPTPDTSWPVGLWDGAPIFIQDVTSPNAPSNAEFVLSSGVFEVLKAGSTAWTEAKLGTFELVSYPDRIREDQGAAKGFPQYHALYARITPYGQSYYTPSNTEDEGRVKIQGVRVHYAYYTLYVVPKDSTDPDV